MQIIAKRTLRLFWQRHPRAEIPLRAWFSIASNEVWETPADIKDRFGRTVDFIADNRVIFDIGGNKFRLIVHIAYPFKRILIKFVGTHAEYDKINPEKV